MSFRTLFVTLLVLASTMAFAPIQQQRFNAVKTATALEFGFLKDLGLEKPDWLPDFGGKKEDTPAPAASEEVAADEEGEEEPAAVEE